MNKLAVAIVVAFCLLLMIPYLRSPSGQQEAKEESRAAEPAAAAQLDAYADVDWHDDTRKLHFKTEDEVLDIAGWPDATYEMPDRLCWYYDVEVARDIGKEGKYPEVQFLEGEVRFILLWSQQTILDKIATAELNDGRQPDPVEREEPMTMERVTALAGSAASMAEVVDTLGEPDLKRMEGETEIWQYHDASWTEQQGVSYNLSFANCKLIEP